MVSKVFTVAPVGFSSKLIEVESDSSSGLPSLQIVGLGNKAIDEAKDRVKSAIVNSLLDYPKRKITVNLAPAELPKDGAHYDLPIALSILGSSGQIRQSELDGAVFAGELALDGTIRPIKGALSIAEGAKNTGIKTIYVPSLNASHASLIKEVNIIPVDNLKQLYLHLKKEAIINPYRASTSLITANSGQEDVTFDDIYGQDQAKRALTIAASGRHNILLTGTPGSGKTMLAQSVVSILPILTDEECLIVTKMHGLLSDTYEEVISKRPFRSPHHSASRISIIGGGTRLTPGEISLAHLGVLFLDEMPEFPRATLESLRQPLEDKNISLHRISGHTTYPADFMLIATMNPCPCGYYGDQQRRCECNSSQIQAYRNRLSGPLMDRIDMVVNVSPISPDKIVEESLGYGQHVEARNTVDEAVRVQNSRYGSSVLYNGMMKGREVSKFANLDSRAKDLLNSAAQKLGLSTRSYFRTIRVSRTIADISGSDSISESHIAEALQYRIHTS